jgi:hypothetical protein
VQRRAFLRATTALATLNPSGGRPADVLRQAWNGDDASERVLRSISNHPSLAAFRLSDGPT